MNLFKKSAVGAALAAGLFIAGSASAATMCSGCGYRFINDGRTASTTGFAPAATYVGSYDPTSEGANGDSGDFTHRGLNGIDSTPLSLANDGLIPASFTDWWIFQISPVAGAGQWAATFNPDDGVTNFKVAIYSIDPMTITAVGAAQAAGTCEDTSDPEPGVLARKGGACGSFGALGALIGSDGPEDQHRVDMNLAVGFYAVKVTGDVTGIARNYVANLSTKAIPEPGSLALVALGLIGAGAVLRRRG